MRSVRPRADAKDCFRSNVLISALHFGGQPEELLLLANQGVIEVFLSPFILEETARVLKEKLGWQEKKVRGVPAIIKEVATIIEPKMELNVIPEDAADNHILACTIQAWADFLVTGDKHHLLPLGKYQGIRILTPRDCLNALARKKGPARG